MPRVVSSANADSLSDTDMKPSLRYEDADHKAWRLPRIPSGSSTLSKRLDGEPGRRYRGALLRRGVRRAPQNNVRRSTGLERLRG